MSPQATVFSFLGIGKETTKGTPIAASAFIPVTTFDPEDKYQWREDVGMRGSMTELFAVYQGFGDSEYGFGGPCFPDVIGHPLLGILGDVQTTVASPLNTHRFTVNNDYTINGQPPAYTIHDFAGVNDRRFPGQQMTELSFRFDTEGMVEYTARSLGYLSTTSTRPSPSYSTVPPILAYQSVSTVNSVTSSIIQSGELTISRKVGIIHTMTGAQTPYKVWAGGIRVSGRASFVYEDDTELTRNSSGQIPLKFDFTEPGAGALAKEMIFDMHAVQYTRTKLQRGKDYIEVEIDFNAVGNATDAGTTGGLSPIAISLKNTVASY